MGSHAGHASLCQGLQVPRAPFYPLGVASNSDEAGKNVVSVCQYVCRSVLTGVKDDPSQEPCHDRYSNVAWRGKAPEKTRPWNLAKLQKFDH